MIGIRLSRRQSLLLLVLAVSTGTGVATGAEAAAATNRLRVTTTTTMVTDLVRQVGGNKVEVTGLMGPGVDPHLYKASARDVTKLQGAEVIIYSGLMLEGKLEEMFSRLGRNGKRVHAVTSAMATNELIQPEGQHGHPDPHVWFDVRLWARTVDGLARALGEARPADRDYFAGRGREVAVQLQALHEWTLRRVSELPAARRVLITSHDAFSYFGRAYGFQVVALQGISTVEEASLASVTQLTDFVRKHQVKAIFVESSVAPNAIRRISQDTGVKVGGELFSDAMGPEGQMENGYDLGTYDGMVRHNVNTIVDALK